MHKRPRLLQVTAQHTRNSSIQAPYAYFRRKMAHMLIAPLAVAGAVQISSSVSGSELGASWLLLAPTGTAARPRPGAATAIVRAHCPAQLGEETSCCVLLRRQQ
jgi:hypothetical protein